MHFSELPVLGVGLGSDVSAVAPNFRAFLEGQGERIDYLNVGAHYVQEGRVRYYIDDLVSRGFPVVFHPINFNISTDDDEAPALLQSVRNIANYLHAVWAGQDVAMWTYGAQYLGAYLIPPILDGVSVAAVVTKVRQLNAAMPCPFLIENPPITFSMESMHVLDFIGAVSREADCGIVLDVGHLIAYQQATGRRMADMPLERFPFDRIVEIHLAGLQFSRVGKDLNVIDQHAYPVHELCWQFLNEHFIKMSNIRGLTLEQEYCETESVRPHLRRARTLWEARRVVACA